MLKTKGKIFLGAVLTALTLPAQPLTNGVALAYFAPENQLFYRLRYPDGGYREFQRSLDNPNRMDGINGWKAMLSGNGRITVTGGVKGKQERYVFDRGRLVSCVLPGKTNSFPYAAVRRAPEDVLPPFHFGSREEKAWSRRSYSKMPKNVRQLLGGKWKKSGRLRWPFANPNENGFLYASLALLSLYLTALNRRWTTCLGIGLALAFFVPLVMTASRGSFLAFAVGLAPMAAVRFRALARSRVTYVILAVAAAVAVAWFATHDARLLTRGFRGKSSWSNETRLDMWKMAPAMMVDAPGGWIANAGRAYLDWYEDLMCFTAPGSLINDHLSKMVRQNWLERAGYVFGWSVLLFGLFFMAFRTKNAVPAGLVAAFAVASWFNPLMNNRWLWIVPLLAPVLAFVDRPWRDGRRWAAAAGCAAAVTVVAMVTIVLLAERTPRPYGIQVRADGPRVLVKGENPSVWIVDDGLSLGGAFSCKELRAHYAAHPHAPSCGYVRTCADLPACRFRRLVLGGAAGDSWLQRICSDAKARENLPEEVVFISPPFPPSAIPPALHIAAKVKYVTGEFNARYCREFDSPPDFVEIVPAMELYLSDWMRYAVAE